MPRYEMSLSIIKNSPIQCHPIPQMDTHNNMKDTTAFFLRWTLSILPSILSSEIWLSLFQFIRKVG
uniref:Oxysterol-binding protein-related protein 2A isoform X1 n=1 Tax=Rhizophora mucronata TaxID=61149 RepID=A0A2P2LXE6_RHIMU